MTPSKKFDLSNRLFSVIALFVIASVIFLALQAYNNWKFSQNNTFREITIEAEGSAYIVPDVAQVRIGVSVTGPNTAEIVQENTEKINKIQEIIKSAGIEDTDIKTTNYSLNPNWQWTQERGNFQDGFTVSQDLEVKIRDFTSIGDIIADATNAGATNIGGVQFIVDDPENAKSAAREEAIKNAKEKAKNIAKQADIKLGDVTNFYEYSNYYPNEPYYAERALSIATDEALAAPIPELEPGEQEITVNVSITYRLR